MRLNSEVEITEDDDEWSYTLSQVAMFEHKIILFRNGNRVDSNTTVTRWGALRWARATKKSWTRSARVEKGYL